MHQLARKFSQLVPKGGGSAMTHLWRFAVSGWALRPTIAEFPPLQRPATGRLGSRRVDFGRPFSHRSPFHPAQWQLPASLLPPKGSCAVAERYGIYAAWPAGKRWPPSHDVGRGPRSIDSIALFLFALLPLPL